MDLELKINSIKVSGTYRSMLIVEIDGADEEEVLSKFSLSEIVKYYGEGELLDCIGKDFASEHFNLTQGE